MYIRLSACMAVCLSVHLATLGEQKFFIRDVSVAQGQTMFRAKKRKKKKSGKRARLYCAKHKKTSRTELSEGREKESTAGGIELVRPMMHTLPSGMLYSFPHKKYYPS